MHWQYAAYTLPLFCAAILSALLAFLAWRRQPAPGAAPAAVLMLAVAGWSLAYAFVIGSADLPAKILWARIAGVCVTIVATAWLVFVLEYAGRKTWLTRRNLVILSAEPLITLLLIWTNDAHGLFWSRVRLDTSGSLPVLDVGFGTWFWIDTLYSYLLLAIGVILLLHLLFHSPRPYRGQITALVIAVIIPWGAHIAHIAGLSPIPHLDPTPFAFTLTGLVLIGGILRFGLLDIAPIARSAVVESTTDGIIVIDSQNRIVDINPAARSMVDRAKSDLIGEPATGVVPGWPDIVEKRRESTDGTQTEIVQGEGEAQRYFDLRRTPLHDWRGRTIGQLIVLHDVTERKRMEEMLRESEEKYRDLFENANDLIQSVAPDGSFLFVNRSWREALGYSEQEIPNLSVNDVIHPDSQAHCWDVLQCVMGGNTIDRVETRFITKDGRTIFVEGSINCNFDDAGKPIATRGIFRDITERKQAETALQRRAEELAALHATSLAITARRDLPTLLQTIIERAAGLLGAPSGGLYLCDLERKVVRCVVSFNTPRDYTGTVLEYGEGAAGKVAETGEPLVIDDYRTWHNQADVFRKEQPFTAVLSAPMMWQGQVIGVIHVLDHTETRRFTSDDLNLLTLFANQAAIAVENARLLEAERKQRTAAEQREAELRDRERYLELLNEITRTAIQQSDLEQMLQMLADRLGGLLDADGCYLTLWDQEKERAIPTAAYGSLAEIYPTIRPEPGEVTLTESVLRAGHAIAVEDVFDSPYTSPRIAAMFPNRSLLGLPLIADGQKLGAILIAFNQLHRFTQEEITLGEQAAQQIALAIAKIRSLEAEREQRRLAEALREVGWELTAELDLDTLLQYIVSRAIELLEGAGGGLYVYRPERDVLEWVVTLGPSTPPTGAILRRGEGLAGKVWESGSSLSIDDYENWDGRAPLYEDYSFGAVVGAPIRWGREFLGVLTVRRSEKVFSESEVELLALFTTQAAIAIKNAYLFEAERRRAQEAETLRRAGAVVVATLNQEEAIERILEQLARVVPYDTASVQLLREEGCVEIVGERGWENTADVVGLRFPVPGDNPNSVVIQEGRPHILTDAPSAYPEFREGPHSHIQSWLGVPLTYRGRVIGMLAVDSTEPHRFTQDHARLATAFGNQVAIALENARLFEAERRRHRELETLRQANLQLTSSLELQPVLEAILDHALKLVAANDAHVFLYDDEQLTFGAASWRDGREQTPYAEPRPGGLTHTVAQSGEQIVISDVNQHPLFQDWQWGGAIIGLPLCLGDQVRGVMNVAFEEPHTFDEAELRVLNLLADQAAIAIRNAQLHAEVQEMATTDELTGLHNRRGFFELGRREVERALRFGRPLTAIMFDLDRFKSVNDACGHVVGDEVLALLATRCRQELRAVDLLARYGGEEFVALLPETDLVTAEEIAERLRRVVDQTNIAALCNPATVTASLGVAALDEECTDLEDLLKRADQALYAAKRTGRDRVCVYGQADLPIDREHELQDQ